MAGSTRRLFRLVLIKPSHYDDDGYVIQWLRSPIPANSLACLYGLAQNCAERQALGPDIELDLVAIDETNRRIKPAVIARSIRQAGAGMVMLVGVQSNQFPRALDLTAAFRRLGIEVGIGGFHVSGTLAMLPGIEPNVQKALDLGAFIFAGEAEEGRLEQVLRDAIAGELKPIYNFMADLPGIEHVPIPHLPASVVKRTYGANASFDAGRGCPFQCSFCTIINVQGRKSRRRSADDVEKIVRENARHGIVRFFITDDNFARNKDWEQIFDRLIQLRERDGINIRFIIQVDTLCHRLPNFIEKAARAGVRRVFIGLENVSPDNLAGGEEAAEQDHRIPKNAARLERGEGADLLRLYPRLSQRHARADPARHPGDPARAAGRHPGILLSHAPAGLGGPQAVCGKRASRWTPTSTTTTSTTPRRRIR